LGQRVNSPFVSQNWQGPCQKHLCLQFVQFMTDLGFGGWKMFVYKFVVRFPIAKTQIGQKINKAQKAK